MEFAEHILHLVVQWSILLFEFNSAVILIIAAQKNHIAVLNQFSSTVFDQRNQIVAVSCLFFQ